MFQTDAVFEIVDQNSKLELHNFLIWMYINQNSLTFLMYFATKMSQKTDMIKTSVPPSSTW